MGNQTVAYSRIELMEAIEKAYHLDISFINERTDPHVYALRQVFSQRREYAKQIKFGEYNADQKDVLIEGFIHCNKTLSEALGIITSL